MTEFPLINAVLFAVLGLAVFAAAASMILRLLPFDFRKAIIDDHNVAAGLVVAALLLGIAWIVAATMH